MDGSTFRNGKTYKMATKKVKRFTAVAKVGWDPIRGNICVKYRFNDLNNFLAFMQRKYSPYWINIFYKSGTQAGRLAYTWGRKKGLEDAK